MSDLVVLSLSREVAGHLAVAIALHRREARRSGLQLPADLDVIAQAFATAAMAGQERPAVDELWAATQADLVPRQLHTLDETAAALAISERTVRRLISAGKLQAVHPGPGITRIRATDLAEYVEHLQHERH